ncbi:MAG: TlpA disulfide reductase family protein [Bacteroidota bacterium]
MSRWFKFIIISGLIVLLSGSYAINKSIRVFNFNEFEPLLHQTSDTIYFINFWATWCVPCREEIPAINELQSKYQDQKFKILLVSLDRPRQIDSSLKPFIEQYNIRSEVVVLDDPDFNSWIDKVSSSWSGSIPATLIYHRDKRKFYEQSFTFNELDSILIHEFL